MDWAFGEKSDLDDLLTQPKVIYAAITAVAVLLWRPRYILPIVAQLSAAYAVLLALGWGYGALGPIVAAFFAAVVRRVNTLVDLLEGAITKLVSGQPTAASLARAVAVAAGMLVGAALALAVAAFVAVVAVVAARRFRLVDRVSHGAEYVYLHFVIRPFFSRRVEEIGWYVHERRTHISAAGRLLDTQWITDVLTLHAVSVQTLHMQVQEALDNPYHARLSDHFLDADADDRLAGGARRLPLEQKRARLNEWLSKYHQEELAHRSMFKKVPLQLRRGAVFDSAAEQLLAASHTEIASGLNIVYTDEQGRWEHGVDVGGLTREFFDSVCAEITSQLDDVDVGSGDSAPGDSLAADRPRLQRQASVRGRGQSVFRLLPDNSLMLAPSGRPPMYYVALGKIFGMAALYSVRGESLTLPG